MKLSSMKYENTKIMSQNVTLVLSGGGARGIAHIGVIEEIVNWGFNIRSIAGTSMGALIGGVFAAGKLPEFTEWAYKLDRQDILRLIDFSFSAHGLVKGDKIINAMKKIIPDVKIEELQLKYSATAFDLTTNSEVIYRSGSLFDAIRASISIPTVFNPVVKGSSIIVDGGVVNNLPISNAYRLENDLLIAVNVNAEIPFEKQDFVKNSEKHRHNYYLSKLKEYRQHFIKPANKEERRKFNYFNLVNDTIAAMSNQITQAQIQKHSPDILIEISKKSAGIFDFYKVEELIEIGRFEANRKLEELISKKNEIVESSEK